MRRNNDEISRQARDDDEIELSEKEQKKLKHRQSVEKRKNIKRKDKVARWGGVILLGLIMFVGFLLWVSGEMKGEIKPLNQRNITPFETQDQIIIVK